MFPTVQNSVTDLVSALQEAVIPEPSTGAKAYLKFNQNGEYLFGRDSEEVTGDELIINTYSFTHGWVVWVNRKSTTSMVSFTKPMPPALDPIMGNEPTEARGFEARFEDLPETIVVFNTSSYGGRQGCDTLLSTIKQKVGRGETRYLFPVVKLSSTSYESKQGNTIFNPVFEIVDWMDEEGNRESGAASLAAPKEAAEQETKPVRRRRTTA